MDRPAARSGPDLASVHDSAHKINGFARAALNSCMDVVSWLAPDETVTCTVGEAATECAGLLATASVLPRLRLAQPGDAIKRPVRRSAIRHMLTGGLLWLTDEFPPPGSCAAGRRASGGVRIMARLQPTQGTRVSRQRRATVASSGPYLLAMAWPTASRWSARRAGHRHLLPGWPAAAQSSPEN
jgi:hypothetical protein